MTETLGRFTLNDPHQPPREFYTRSEFAALEAEVARLSDENHDLTVKHLASETAFKALRIDHETTAKQAERLKALLREWVAFNDSPCDVDERTQHCYGHAVLACHPVPCLIARTRAALGKQQEGSS